VFITFILGHKTLELPKTNYNKIPKHSLYFLKEENTPSIAFKKLFLKITIANNSLLRLSHRQLQLDSTMPWVGLAPCNANVALKKKDFMKESILTELFICLSCGKLARILNYLHFIMLCTQYLTLRSVLSLNNPQNSKMKFCEKYES
jgi:hypothetical protein